MRGSLVLLGFVGCLTTPAVAAEPRVRAATAEKQNLSDDARARQLFRVGMNAFKVGRIEEARQLLGEAWDLRQSYDIAALLGQVEFELGNPVRATELLDYSLENFPPIESDDRLSTIRKMRDKVMSHVTSFDISCDCDGETLLVDGSVVSTLPLTKPLYVQPGHHQLSLQRGGVTWGAPVEVEAQAGQRMAVSLSAKPVEKPVEHKGTPRVPVGEAKDDALPTWPLYVGGGLTAVTITAAIGFKFAADGASERANSERSQLGGATEVCRTATDASVILSCSQYSDATSDEDLYARLTTYTAGAAATFAVATVAYWVWSKPTARSAQQTGTTTKTTPLVWSVFGDSQSAYVTAFGRF